MTKGVKRYFESFGEVESIRMHTKGQSNFSFVQFKSAEAAKAVLSKSIHRVAKCTFTVKPAHEKHQPDFKEFKPPKQESPQHILHALNDDCLEHVFKLFKLLDLSVAADVCVRFQFHALQAFKLKYKHAINRAHVAEFKNRPEKFEDMLRNFGSLIHSLAIDQKTLKIDAIDQLKLIGKYAPALKHLTLFNFGVDEYVNDLRPLFSKLETLSLSSCGFTDGAEELLTPCAELKHLSMDDFDWDNVCIDHAFPKLEEVHMNGCSTVDDAEFKKFIQLNPTLKKLSISGNSELKSASIFQAIGQYSKNLVELEIDQENFERKLFQKCALSLGRLGSLKKLTLNNIGLSATPLLKKLAVKAVPLEHLSLKKGSIDSDAIKSMSELLKLNHIELENIKNLTDDHVNELAKLPQLRAVHLEGSTAEDITTVGLRNMLNHAKVLSHLVLKRATNIQIGMNDYSAMLKSVQDRPQKIKLEIEITGDGDKIDVPDEVLSVNREWLWIDEEIEEDDDDDDDNSGLAMMAFHIFVGLGRMMQQHDDSDESTENESDNSGMNFDLD